MSDVTGGTPAARRFALLASLVLVAGCGGSESQPGDASAPEAQADAPTPPVDSSMADDTLDASGEPISDSATDGADSPTMTDAAVGDAAGNLGDGGACNGLADSAPFITAKEVAATPPPPQGGTITDGLYWMTDLSIYTGPNGPWGPLGSVSTTWQITGGTLQGATSMGLPSTYTVALMASGPTSLELDETCPHMMPESVSYTATASTFLMYVDTHAPGVDGGPATWVWTFTKQ